MADWRLAVDIGGTFTDVVLLDVDSGRVVVDKTLTTPSAPLEGVRAGVSQLLSKAGVAPGEITAPIVHATTLITNALIEGRTGRAGLVTTTGFGDTLLIRDEHRYDMYDLQIEFPDPPIGRDLTFEIAERTSATGAVLAEPSATDLARLSAGLADAAVESVAVCLLNSYVNPANEQAVAEHLRQQLSVPVCISAEISPQIREYPRMITAACNAATMPVIGPYLDELQKWLSAEGFGGAVLMMLSNGGVVSADDAARGPIRLVESGPAAGALAGTWYAQRLGSERLLCFDMGGTTAKACLIEDGEPALTNTFEVARIYRFKKGSGFPVSVPSVDLVEIGAGGGSLARLDRFGLLKVGPESAGADPGPASYGRGGTTVAVTDADVVLGLLDPDAFLGGDMPLDAAAAAAATEKPAAGLGLSLTDTAAGIHEVVNQNMAAAARMHGVEQGVDLRGVNDSRLRRCGTGSRLWRGRPARERQSDLPRQCQRALGVRHSGVAGADRPGPLHASASRQHGHRRAGRSARRAARRGSQGALRGRGALRRCAFPLRARCPVLRAGQRDHGLGGHRRVMARKRSRRAVRLRVGVPAHLRNDHPRCGHRGGHLAAIGLRRESAGASRHGRCRGRGGRRAGVSSAGRVRPGLRRC